MENKETTTFGTVEQQKAEKREQNNRSGWQTVTIGGVSGILMGAGGMYAANAFAAGEEPTEETGEETANASATTTPTASSHMADNGLQVAEVDQGLSFGEAFAAAREAVGPGGVFHWHGNIYNTYTAAEWENMTAAEHQQFAQQVQPEVRPGEGPHKNDVAQHTPKVEKQEGEHEGGSGKTDDDNKPDEPVNPDEPVIPEEPEVRFLGVERVETEEGPWNVGHMVRGEQEVALVDMDDDYVFDVAVSDMNDNGEIERNEVIDVSEDHLTVTDFALASAQQEASSATDAQPETAAHTQQDQIGDDMPDYMNDADMQTI